MTARRWALVAASLAAIAAIWAYLAAEEDTPGVIMRSFPVGDAPVSVSVGEDVWVANGGTGTLSRFPERDPDAASEIEVGGRPSQLSVGGGTVWVAYPVGHAVTSVAEVDAEQAEFEVGRTPSAVVADGDGAYFAALDDGAIWRVDDQGPRRFVELDEGFPSALALGFGSLWMTDVVHDQLIRLDPDSGEITARIDVGTAPTAVAVGEDSIWVANFNDATVTRVDPNTERVQGRPIAVGGKPGGLVEALGFVWVTRPEDDSAIRIDLDTGLWTAEVFKVGKGPTGIAAGDAIWITNTEDDTVTRLMLPR